MSNIKSGIKELTSFQQRFLSSLLIVPTFLLSIYFGGIPFFLLMGFLLFMSFHEWSTMAEKSPTEKKDCTIASAYLAIGIASLFLVRLLPEDAMLVTLSLIFLIWAADTGAYIIGKLIGGKKLCPTISPGKTWAGFFGGLTASIITAYACHVVFGIYNGLFSTLIIGSFVFIAGLAGDLAISKYKRYVNVKDTGALLPGHGGILDRIDSLLLAAPVYLILILFLHHPMG